MADRSRLDWQVPAGEWQSFRSFVDSEYAEIDGNLGRTVDSAMQEYLDQDRYADLEGKVNELIEAAGRTPDAGDENKKSDLASQETTRASPRVQTDLKADFKRFAKKNGHRPGVALARALQSYRQGGRAARLEDKLDRVLDDATDLLAEVDSESDGSLSLREKRVRAIANKLDQSYTDEELDEAIATVAGDSDPTLRDYRNLVPEYTGHQRHPANDSLWISEDEAADYYSDDVPAEARRDVVHLDRDERVRRLQLAVGHRAKKSSTKGRGDAEAHELYTKAMDENISKRSLHSLIDAAAETPGFTVKQTTGTKRLAVTLPKLRDAAKDGDDDLGELFNDIIAYGQSEAVGLLRTREEATMQDFTSATTGSAQSGTAADGGTDRDDRMN